MNLQELHDDIKAEQEALNKMRDSDEKININLFLKYLRDDTRRLMNRAKNMRGKLDELKQRVKTELQQR